MYGQGKTRGQVGLLKTAAATNQAVAAIVPHQIVKTNFLYSFLEKEYLHIRNYANSGSQSNLSLTIIGSQNIIFSKNIVEQSKIGNIFSNISTLITLQQRKLEQLKQLKKAMLQQLFVDKNSKQPNLRFKNFNSDWKQCKLIDSANYIRGSFPQPYGNKEWYGGPNSKPFVQVIDVDSNLKLNKHTKEQISVLAQPKSRFVPSGSVVVTLQGSIGRVAITQFDSYVDRTLLIFTKYKVPIDKYFWAHSIQNIFHIEKQKAPGGTIKTITKHALSSFEVRLPVQKEQREIGLILKNIENLINLQQNKLTQLSTLKKYLLQKMFI